MVTAARQLNDLTTHELIEHCKHGESEAWSALITRFGCLVHSIPHRYGMCEADADDVFQSVIAKLFRCLAQVKDPRKLPSWLITVTRRECWRLQAGRWETGDLADRSPISDESVEDQATRREQQRIVHEALGRLSEPERQLITAFFLDSTSPSYAAVAARLDRKIGSIGPTRARIFRKLERTLIKLGLHTELDLDSSMALARRQNRNAA